MNNLIVTIENNYLFTESTDNKIKINEGIQNARGNPLWFHNERMECHLLIKPDK